MAETTWPSRWHLRHEKFNVTGADVVTVLLLNGPLGVGSAGKIDDGLARRATVIVPVNLNAIRSQLVGKQISKLVFFVRPGRIVSPLCNLLDKR